MGRPLHNLLLLTVDAWRADFVDAFDGIKLTPTLGSLPRPVRFTAAHATGPWTSPALISIFSGENPAVHGVHHEWSVPRAGGPALATQLQAAGYQTPNVCYLNRVGNYQNLGYAAATAPDYPTGPDDDLLLRTLRELRSAGGEQPWFVWYHYKYVHLPYWPAPAYRRLFCVDDARLPQRLRDSVASRFVVPRGEFTLLPEDRELVRRLYAGGVRQMDDFLGRVVAELDAGGLLGRTSLVVTADHGDELLERGHVGHASTAHHATLHDEVLRIPLVIVDPRAQGERTVAERVQGLDLFPTLLSLAGVPSDQNGEAVDLAPLVLEGRLPSRLREPRTFFAASSRMGYLTPRSHEEQWVQSLCDGRHKYIWERYDEPRRLLFDLEQDPGELAPLTAGPAVESAHATLLDFLAAPERPPSAVVADAEDSRR